MQQDRALTEFWDLLEADFPLALPRRIMCERLSPELVELLEDARLLSFMGIAETYPCPHPGGANCPRRVVHLPDGRIEAVCGNDPPECGDVSLTEKDIEVLGVQPEQLCEAIRKALQLGGRAEQVADLPQVYRTGTYNSSPTSRCNVYLVVRSEPAEYATAFHALRSRGDGERLSILVPTDHFVSEDDVQAMSRAGVPIICLAQVLDMDSAGQLSPLAPTEHLFAATAATALASSPSADLDDDGWYIHSTLADHFGLGREALRKQLERWRKKHFDGWKENTDRRPREPKHLYQLSSVQHIIDKMLTSSERPAR
jgi:hypothetical protein